MQVAESSGGKISTRHSYKRTRKNRARNTEV